MMNGTRFRSPKLEQMLAEVDAEPRHVQDLPIELQPAKSAKLKPLVSRYRELWGSWRPQVYFGVRAAMPPRFGTPVVGVAWIDSYGMQKGRLDIRHGCEQGHGLKVIDGGWCGWQKGWQSEWNKSGRKWTGVSRCRFQYRYRCIDVVRSCLCSLFARSVCGLAHYRPLAAKERISCRQSLSLAIYTALTRALEPLSSPPETLKQLCLLLLLLLSSKLLS